MESLSKATRPLLLGALVIASACTTACNRTELPANRAHAYTRPPVNQTVPSAPPANNVHLDPTSPIRAAILVEPVSKVCVESIVEATAQLQPNANCVTRVSSPLPGTVTSVKACIGDTVHPGQVLATVTSREISGMITDLFQAENQISSDLSREVLQIDCEIDQERAEIALCEKQCNRAKLLMDERIGSLAVLESAQTNLRKHEITLASLKAKRSQTIEISGKKKVLARQALEDKLKVLGMPTSTIDMICSRDQIFSSVPLISTQKGVVLDRDINVGELVEPSRNLFVVDDIDNLWLEANVFEKDVERVKHGQHIQFVVDSFPNEVFRGKLDFVAGIINPTTRTLAVRSVIDNPKLKLKPKMFARMKIFVGKKTVLALPTSAIQDAGSHKVVFVQKSANLFEQRQVELGEQTGKFVAVLDGVEAGEKVVTKGSMPLRALVMRKMR